MIDRSHHRDFNGGVVEISGHFRPRRTAIHDVQPREKVEANSNKTTTLRRTATVKDVHVWLAEEILYIGINTGGNHV